MKTNFKPHSNLKSGFNLTSDFYSLGLYRIYMCSVKDKTA